MSAQENRQITIAAINRDLDKMLPQFGAALPAHIPPERFKRVAQTAINQNPDLINADRQALWAACMRAAQDGLLPDGREGALVMFKGKPAWMPMVGGIIKKMRNSGELASISAHPVYEKDKFLYAFGDDERIEHSPCLDGDAGKMIAVYAIAKLKDGTVQREVMTRAEVDKVKATSPSGNNGPWGKWYEEMARKTVVRRLSKYLPMSTDLERMMADMDVMAGAEDHRAERAVDVTPPRPARADFTQPATTVVDVDADPRAQPEPVDPYQFVDTDGEVTETDDPSAFASMLTDAMGRASTTDIADGLWESNSPVLASLPTDLADDCRAAYDEALGRLTKPVETEPERPRPTALTVPVKSSGVKDYASFCEVLGGHIARSSTVDDLNTWQDLNINEMDEAKRSVPRAYAALEEIIGRRGGELLAEEG